MNDTVSAQPAADDPSSSGPLSRLCRGCAAAGVAVLLACALVTVGDVVARRTVGLSLPGLIDLTQLMVMCSVFLCIPYTFERRANVEVDLLFERLPGVVRRMLAVLWALASAAFLSVAAWHAGRAALQVLEYGERSPTLGWPMIAYWVPILFGCVLAGVVCLAQAIRPDPSPLPSTEPIDDR